jgi:hypothetical protein
MAGRCGLDLLGWCEGAGEGVEFVELLVFAEISGSAGGLIDTHATRPYRTGLRALFVGQCAGFLDAKFGLF